MTCFRVTRLYRDEQERNYSEFKDFPTFAAAQKFANTIARKDGEVWIEQREPGRRPILTDRKDQVPEADPMTPEHLAELRAQIKSLAAKTRLPKEGT